LINRIGKYPLSIENKTVELNITRQIAKENDYSHSIIKRKRRNRQGTSTTVNNPHESTQIEKKWLTFTYTGKETRHITKLFKSTTVKTAYRTRNTIKILLQPKLQEHINKYSRPGV
jgi:exonuclease III